MLCSLFTENPLTNEPGIGLLHRDVESYNKIITYKNMETAIFGVLTKKILPEEFNVFDDIIKNHFKDNFNDISEKITKLIEEKDDLKVVKTDCYNLNIICKYTILIKNLNKLYDNICN